MTNQHASTYKPGSFFVATLYASNAPPLGPMFDSWSNLLTTRPVDIVNACSVSGSTVVDGRNLICRRFLASEAEWLFMVDSDMAFAIETLPALRAHADADDRPIVGALCFKVHRDGEVEPTMYRLASEPSVHLQTVQEWQRGALVQVDATGAACLLLHRRVLEAMEEPWFDLGELGGSRIGEDITFCLTARSAGFPIYVASSVEVGHVKPYAFGLADYERQEAARAAVGTFVVIPVRSVGDPVPITALSSVVAGVIAIPNDGPLNIMRKFNHGLEWAAQEARAEGRTAWNVLFLNDDVALEVDDVLPKLSAALRADPSHAVAYPNVHGIEGSGIVATSSDEMAGQSLSGYCFMVRGESALRFDEHYPWWYGDSDLEKRVNAAGMKVVCALDATIEHLHPTESTRGELLEQAKRDEARFAEQYGLDPSSLFLAQHPEFGQKARVNDG